MYICICKSLSERDLREHIDQHGGRLAEIEKACGAGTDCGSCRQKFYKFLCENGVETNTNESVTKNGD